MSMIRDGKGEVITAENPLQVGGIVESTTQEVMPVDIQARMTHLIQTQAGVTILPNNGDNKSGWIDSHVDGSPLTYLGLTVSMTSGTGMKVYVDFSHDGSLFISNYVAYDGASNVFSTDKDIQLPARYFRVGVTNKDASNPKVTTSYGLLKA